LGGVEGERNRIRISSIWVIRLLWLKGKYEGIGNDKQESGGGGDNNFWLIRNQGNNMVSLKV